MSVAGWVWFFAAISAVSLAAASAASSWTLGLKRLSAHVWPVARRLTGAGLAVGAFIAATAGAALAQTAPESAGGEANLKLPDLSQVNFLGIDGHKLLMVGILFC